MSITTRPRRLLVVVLVLVATLVLVVPATASAAPTGTPPGSAARSDAQAAADVLMTSYDTGKAWFPSSWWNSAVALQTIGDYMQRTGDRRYLPQLDLTFEQDKGTFPAGELSGDPLLGNFTSRAIDDSEWWGLTWLQAYDLTGNPKYLDMAVKIATYVDGYWDTGTCGGGVWWDAERTYKNAVTNGLWIRLTAELHNRMPGDRTWLGRATTGWTWFTGSGMVSADGLVNDGLTAGCGNNGGTVWSYNQGVAIGAGLELWRATRDPKVLATAKRLADAGTTRPELVSNGNLTESCDALDRTCDDNGKQFKGVFMRYLMDAADTTHDPGYVAFVDRQASSITTSDRDDLGRLGERWSGADPAAYPNARDWRTQASALSALVAVLPARGRDARAVTAALSPTESVLMTSSGAAATEALTLSVAVSAPRDTRVHLSASAPSGWTVTPASGDLTLRPRGRTTQQQVSVTVAVPAGTSAGTYAVTVTAAAGHDLTWRAVAHVTVARSIAFDTGTAAELPWLSADNGSQSSGPGNRFADGTHSFAYRFPLPTDTTSAAVTLSIDNEYLVQASPDGLTWTTVLTESRRVTDGSNKEDRTIDLTPFLGADRSVCVRVADSFPDDGWGGRVSHVAVAIGS